MNPNTDTTTTARPPKPTTATTKPPTAPSPFDDLIANAPAAIIPLPNACKKYRYLEMPNTRRTSPLVITDQGCEFGVSYCHRVDVRGESGTMEYTVGLLTGIPECPTSLEAIDAAVVESLKIGEEFGRPGMLKFLTPERHLCHCLITPANVHV